LERDFRAIVGTAPLAHLKPAHIGQLVAEKAGKSPAGARVMLAAIRAFTRYCIAVELLRHDPAIGTKTPKVVNPDGYHTWSEDQIRQFEDTHPVGSLARLGFGLHLFTIQRTGDVIDMGRQNVGRDGVTRLTQKKRGAKVAIPIHPELQRILDTVPLTAELRFLHALHGKRFGQNQYNAMWRKWREEAGLPRECVPRGLRKAGMDRLAEVGCTVHEIAAISGHKTLAQVQHYTAKVDRERVRGQAVDRLKTGARSV
jgi:integrase